MARLRKLRVLKRPSKADMFSELIEAGQMLKYYCNIGSEFDGVYYVYYKKIAVIRVPRNEISTDIPEWRYKGDHPNDGCRDVNGDDLLFCSKCNHRNSPMVCLSSSAPSGGVKPTDNTTMS